PAYQDYTVRAKVSEGLNVAGAAKLAVSETYQSDGSLPTTNAEAGLAAAGTITGNNVASVGVGTDGGSSAGRIVITYANDDAINNQTLGLSPTTGGGSIVWTCGQTDTTVLSKYRPSTCR